MEMNPTDNLAINIFELMAMSVVAVGFTNGNFVCGCVVGDCLVVEDLTRLRYGFVVRALSE